MVGAPAAEALSSARRLQPAGATPHREILLVQDMRRLGHHGSNAVVDVIVRELTRRGFAVRSQLEKPVDLNRLSGRFSAVVVNGEGSLHSAQAAAHAIAEAARCSSRQGVPAFLINTVFDETDTGIIFALRGFSGIYTRENLSRERLAALGIAAESCPDLSLCADGMPAWVPGDRVIVTDSALASTSAELHAFARENGLEFLTLRTVPRFAPGRSIRFNARRYIGKWFPGSHRLNKFSSAIPDPAAFFKRMAHGTRLAIAARFHAVCFCLKIGVPFLALPSRTHKIEAMLGDAGLEHRLLERLDMKAIALQAPWSTSDEANRKSYVEGAQAKAAAMFDAIAEAALDEPVLEDGYPVYAGHYYLADGKVVRSPATGTVAELKAATGASRIQRCDPARLPPSLPD